MQRADGSHDDRGARPALPPIVSVDDHVVEPPDLWTSRLCAADLADGPRVERRRGRVVRDDSGAVVFVEDPSGRWGDVWRYEETTWPLTAGYAAVGELRELHADTFVTFDDLEPGCYRQPARLAAMTSNQTEASLCFPTFPRFCGQRFLGATDLGLARRCVEAYNDWILEEWCAGAGAGRLLPVTLVPLWDVDLAVAEVERCAAAGSCAIAFSEAPHHLGLPSVHSGQWDRLFAACAETGTTVAMHIGSSSRLPTTADDAPHMVLAALTFENSAHAFVDWLTSGLLVRHPSLHIALAEGQAGWMPFVLERLDSIWERGRTYERDLWKRIPERPSSYMRHRVYCCVFDDLHALKNRHEIGTQQLMFETDYPHADSTHPRSRDVAARLCEQAGLDDHETWRLMRGNAIECFRLDRMGIVA